MDLPLKYIGQWIHEYREKIKMFVGDGGRFLKNCALEFAEIAWACYHHPYAYPHETYRAMDAWFSEYGKDNFFLCAF